MVSATAQRVDRLLGFLDADPDNLSLIADAADAALEAGRLDMVSQLLDRHAALAPPPPRLANLAGVAAMRQGRFDAAETLFAEALAAEPGDPALRHNLAWAKAARSDLAGASDLLDETVAAAVPAAAALKVRVLHRLGEVEDALAWGAGFVDRFPGDADLLGALSSAALDAEENELAAAYAERGGEAPDALATLGMLRLDAANPEEAAAFFDRALAVQKDSGRALLGKGLVAMAALEGAEAARHLDRAAGVFGDHVGSWVTAGWAYFLTGDLVRARQRFETALAVDDTFAEAHGGLAVIDVLDKRLDAARRGAQTALRLDRECFSAVLARSLLLEAEGDPKSAERLRRTAMDTPVGPSGQTIAQMSAALAGRRSR
jgi:Tfp pilus assembly protein PilF